MQTTDAWRSAPASAIHPLRSVSESAYWASGRKQAIDLVKHFHFGDTILDFGAGDGRVALPLAELGHQVVAVDGSEQFLKSLEQRADGNVVTVCGDESSLEDLTVDGVVCLAVLIHHSFEDSGRIVTELSRATRPGGLLILDWPTADRPHQATNWIDVSRWSIHRQDTLAASLGLTRQKTDLPWSVWRKND